MNLVQSRHKHVLIAAAKQRVFQKVPETKTTMCIAMRSQQASKLRSAKVGNRCGRAARLRLKTSEL
eukprot:28393-Pleurochrysis_carterae.AAC.1